MQRQDIIQEAVNIHLLEKNHNFRQQHHNTILVTINGQLYINNIILLCHLHQ